MEYVLLEFVQYAMMHKCYLVAEYFAKMVPESCCVKSQYGIYFNLQKCQNWALGPPNLQSGPDTNEAVFYSVSYFMH